MIASISHCGLFIEKLEKNDINFLDNVLFFDKISVLPCPVTSYLSASIKCPYLIRLTFLAMFTLESSPNLK